MTTTQIKQQISDLDSLAHCLTSTSQIAKAVNKRDQLEEYIYSMNCWNFLKQVTITWL